MTLYKWWCRSCGEKSELAQFAKIKKDAHSHLRECSLGWRVAILNERGGFTATVGYL